MKEKKKIKKSKIQNLVKPSHTIIKFINKNKNKSQRFVCYTDKDLKIPTNYKNLTKE